MAQGCVFCEIIARTRAAVMVLEDENCVAVLDQRPVFVGHTLVVPRAHHKTLLDLPTALMEPLFADVRLIAAAAERGLGADGTWIAVNNKVSQSVDHLHVHVVPRHFSDGLKGFFWPRRRYTDDAHMQQTAADLRAALAELRPAF